MSALEALLDMQLRGLKAEKPDREYPFAAQHVGPGPGVRNRLKEAGLKNWRFDFAWPRHMFAVEVEGGGWTNGRHTRPTGFREDMEKYHHAHLLGWRIYRCDARLVETGDAAQLILKTLAIARNAA